MGKPTELRLIGGKEPRQFMWEVVRNNRDGFTARQVIERSGQSDGSVLQYINALSKGSFIELIDKAELVADNRWRLIRDEGADFPKVNSKGERSKDGLVLESLWRTVRIMGEVTAAQAAEMASTDEVKVSQAYVLNYFSHLVRAGYLVGSEFSVARARTYRLASSRGFGPRHPIVRRTDSIEVYDPNLDKVVFARATRGGVTVESTLENDLQQQNLRMKKLLTEFMKSGAGAPSIDLLQRTQLELAE